MDNGLIVFKLQEIGLKVIQANWTATNSLQSA